MSELALDPREAIDLATDPGEFVVMALERGKSWLAEALERGDLDALLNAKGYAATLLVATTQKQLGKDAVLSATELVRRAERCIGLGIRAGQEAGAIRRPKNAGQPRTDTGPVRLPRATDYATPAELHGSGVPANSSFGIYDITDGVSDEQFEAAIEQGKVERDLSRANVVRHVKVEAASDKVKFARELAAGGHSSAQIATHLGYSREGANKFLKRHGIDVPADASVAGTRNLDSVRIVRATVEAIDGIGILFPRVDYSQLDPADVTGWLPILDESIRSLTTLRTALRKVSQP